MMTSDSHYSQAENCRLKPKKQACILILSEISQIRMKNKMSAISKPEVASVPPGWKSQA
jgi:hypothetical protein